MRDQALLTEDPERLTQSIARNIEFLRQRGFGQPLTGAQLSSDETVSEPVDQGRVVIHLSILLKQHPELPSVRRQSDDEKCDPPMYVC
ncbi:hypothetical protein BI49514_02475 [Brevibacterium iodinum ATCC 49514]|uniref:Uncharacterized protein n=1 Tax=Brevibacterium iodinum ATCC 49514 TaxID=1255616 RepID=A0A2H1JXL5_9MICO|nr:hypothetical protein BI49514_02475 [Brevibacterium iodinum ATCC 49514]